MLDLLIYQGGIAIIEAPPLTIFVCHGSKAMQAGVKRSNTVPEPGKVIAYAVDMRKPDPDPLDWIHQWESFESTFNLEHFINQAKALL